MTVKLYDDRTIRSIPGLRHAAFRTDGYVFVVRTHMCTRRHHSPADDGASEIFQAAIISELSSPRRCRSVSAVRVSAEEEKNGRSTGWRSPTSKTVPRAFSEPAQLQLV